MILCEVGVTTYIGSQVDLYETVVKSPVLYLEC